jgi:hypothetical protein
VDELLEIILVAGAIAAADPKLILVNRPVIIIKVLNILRKNKCFKVASVDF